MSVDIGGRIREIRKSQKITLKALSQATGLSESYLSQVERGGCAPSVSSLEKISEVLNINMDVLVLEDQTFQTALCEQPYSCPDGVPYFLKQLSNNDDGKRIKCEQVTILPKHINWEFPLNSEGFIYILSGYLTIELNGNDDFLFPGDSLYHDKTMNVVCRNEGPYFATFLYGTYLEKEEG